MNTLERVDLFSYPVANTPAEIERETSRHACNDFLAASTDCGYMLVIAAGDDAEHCDVPVICSARAG